MNSTNDKYQALLDIDLFVIDFSAIVNSISVDELNELIQFWVQNNKKVAVTRDFYENYEVIIQCQNEEQKLIAKHAVDTLEELKKSGLLGYFTNQTRPSDVVDKLCQNPKVGFVYFRYSEFAESVCAVFDKIQVKCVIVDEKGKYIVCDNRDQIICYSSNRIDESILGNDFFKSTFDAEEGAKVKTRDGVQYELTSLIAAGGEGTVFNCSTSMITQNGEYVIKIYHKGQLNKLRLKKLMLMESKKLDFKGICWPEKIVYSLKGEPVGYIMKKVKGKPLTSIFNCDEDLLREYPYWKKTNILKVIVDLLYRIQYLHLFGILVGDLRLKNIMLDSQGNIILVDIDSCQINNIPCPAGIPDFTAPEIHNIEFGKQLRTYYNENYSCAVLMFELLFCGLHPYDQKYGADFLATDMKEYNFPYPRRGAAGIDRVPWGAYKGMWKHMPNQYQEFLYNIFKKGERYGVVEMILMTQTYIEYIELNSRTYKTINDISFETE